MIGKAYVSTTQFYNNQTRRMEFKGRPILIIGQADSEDYVILPISRITRTEYIDTYYDVPLNQNDFPLMNLSAKSYIRTHKQQTIHRAQLTREITDFKENYPDAYINAVAKVDEFQKNLIERAI